MTAWKVGLVEVRAAGDQGRLPAAASAGLEEAGSGIVHGPVQRPADDPWTTRGAVHSVYGSLADGRIATYSPRGLSRSDSSPERPVAAPGDRGRSLPLNRTQPDRRGSSRSGVLLNNCTRTGRTARSSDYRLSGTSMAAPVVAGAAAKMLQVDPSLALCAEPSASSNHRGDDQGNVFVNLDLTRTGGQARVRFPGHPGGRGGVLNACRARGGDAVQIPSASQVPGEAGDGSAAVALTREDQRL